MVAPNRVLLGFGFVQSFLCTGILYGWPGLVLILKKEGLYAERCEIRPNAGETCQAQQQALNTLFTVAQGCLTGAMVINGAVLDRLGPRLVSIYGTVLVVAALLVFGFVVELTAGAVDVALPALSVLGLGGSAVHLSWFHVSNLFPKRKQTAASIVVAGFVGSGMVFPIWQLLGVGRRQVFISHAAAVACLLPFAARLWPRQAFALGQPLRWGGGPLGGCLRLLPGHLPADAGAGAVTEAVEEVGKDAKPVEAGAAEAKQPAAAVAAAEGSQPEAGAAGGGVAELAIGAQVIHLAHCSPYPRARRQRGAQAGAWQLRRPEFWHLLLFFSNHFFRYVWLLGTLNDQLERAGDAAHDYAKAAGWLLPIAALTQVCQRSVSLQVCQMCLPPLATKLQPLIGMAIDRFGFAAMFCATATLGLDYPWAVKSFHTASVCLVWRATSGTYMGT